MGDSSKKLLPCPFCGSDLMVIVPDTYDTRYVRCSDCFSKGEPRATEDDAIDAWNARHNDTVTTLQAKVARLEAQQSDPSHAARVLLGDDMHISKMAKAMHDGPLGADDHWFSAANEQGAWCVDMARAALRAIALDTTTATCDNTREGE